VLAKISRVILVVAGGLWVRGSSVAICVLVFHLTTRMITNVAWYKCGGMEGQGREEKGRNNWREGGRDDKRKSEGWRKLQRAIAKL